MAARKKVTKKKAPAKKSSPARKSSKTAAPAKKKAAPKKKAATAAKKPEPRTAAPKPVVAAKPATAKPVGPPRATGTISADAVSLGHVMSLRPRVHVGFKPTAFSDAKRALAENRYATIEEAARAVADKAIEISNEFAPGSPFTRR